MPMFVMARIISGSTSSQMVVSAAQKRSNSKMRL